MRCVDYKDNLLSVKWLRLSVLSTVCCSMLWLFSFWCFSYAAEKGCDDPYRLELRLLPSSDTALVLPLQVNELFGIRYIHSVDIKPVFEIFKVSQKGDLVIRDTYFRMFGAGMGYIAGRGKLGSDGNWLWIKDINDSVNGFILRVGSLGVAHTLLYRGREINLSKTWAGRRIQFVLKRNEWCN